MEKNSNGMALAGFILSLCSAPLFAAGFLCLIGVMLAPCLSLVFGTLAGSVAAMGVALSGIGNYRSHKPDTTGAGFSVAGMIIAGEVIKDLVK